MAALLLALPTTPLIVQWKKQVRRI